MSFPVDVTRRFRGSTGRPASHRWPAPTGDLGGTGEPPDPPGSTAPAPAAPAPRTRLIADARAGGSPRSAAPAGSTTRRGHAGPPPRHPHGGIADRGIADRVIAERPMAERPMAGRALTAAAGTDKPRPAAGGDRTPGASAPAPTQDGPAPRGSPGGGAVPPGGDLPPRAGGLPDQPDQSRPTVPVQRLGTQRWRRGRTAAPGAGHATLFDLLARIAITLPVRVLTITGLLLLALLPWSAGVFDRLSTGGLYAPGDSATRAEALLDAEFPGAPPNVAVMITAPGDIDGPTARRLGENITGQLRREPDVSGVLSYWSDGPGQGLLRSQDGRSGLVLLRLTGAEDHIQRHVEELHDRYAHDGPGVTVRLGGAPAVMRDVTEQSRHDLERAELVTAPLVFGVLLYAFGGVSAALLPVVVGGSAVIASLALLRLISGMTHISVFSLNLTTALGFALAVDYCLFILRRFREEREAGHSHATAVSTSLRTAGRTVLFSGVTVALSLTGALMFPLPYLRSYAYAGIAVVVASELAALLVLPAAIMLLGDRVDGRRTRTRGLPGRTGSTAGTGAGGIGAGPAPGSTARRRRRREPGAVWGAIASRVMSRPLIFAAVAVALMAAMAFPLTDLRVALADDTVLPTSADSHVVDDAMREAFAVCLPCQIPVVVAGVDAREPAVIERLGGYAADLSRVPGMARVDTVAGSFAGGRRIAPPPPDGGPYVGVHGGAWLSLWPTEPDPMSAATQRTAHLIRDLPPPYPVDIGGLAPHLVETRDTVLRALPGAIAVVIVATFVLLFLFTGSVLLPIKALLLNALNLAAVMGTMVLVFQEGHLQNLVGHFQVSGAVELTSPVLMFCIAFGLSMDYEIFLLARIREEYQRGGDNRRAVVHGLAATGPLLTCAALALIVVMIGVATSQISIIKMIGAGLALAVILDVTVIRAILVPAFMALAGRYNWWAPGPLRLLHERFGLREGDDEAPAVAAPATPATAVAARRAPARPTVPVRRLATPAHATPAHGRPAVGAARPARGDRGDRGGTDPASTGECPAVGALGPGRPDTATANHDRHPGRPEAASPPRPAIPRAGATHHRPVPRYILPSGAPASPPAPTPAPVWRAPLRLPQLPPTEGAARPDDPAANGLSTERRTGHSYGTGGAGEYDPRESSARDDQWPAANQLPTLEERLPERGVWSADAWLSPHSAPEED